MPVSGHILLKYERTPKKASVTLHQKFGDS